MLAYLFQGLLPSGFGLHADGKKGFAPLNSKKNGIDQEYVNEIGESMQKRRPHVLVFCLTESDISEKGSRDKIKEILSHIRAERIPTIFNLTKADTISEELAENPFVEQVFDDEKNKKKSENEDLAKAIEQHCKDLGITPDQMIYSVSYGEKKQNRTFEYDKQIFRNLEIIQREAMKYATYLEKPENSQIGDKASEAIRDFKQQFRDDSL